MIYDPIFVAKNCGMYWYLRKNENYEWSSFYEQQERLRILHGNSVIFIEAIDGQDLH
jgi:hypothetical protein